MSESIDDDKFFPLSAVNHYSFCPRRCALIHSECFWNENFFTASGENLHATVDAGGSESRKERRLARSLRLFSRELGVNGIADIVEFHRDDENGGIVRGWQGRWLPYPVEYKWGTAKNEIPYERQLCAQAICLEEMFHVRIQEGALFLGVEKKRRSVVLDDNLRYDTKIVCNAIRNMFETGETPPPTYGKWCSSCSLVDICKPHALSSHHSVKQWLIQQLDNINI